jgi:hypothetical protein
VIKLNDLKYWLNLMVKLSDLKQWLNSVTQSNGKHNG